LDRMSGRTWTGRRKAGLWLSRTAPVAATKAGYDAVEDWLEDQGERVQALAKSARRQLQARRLRMAAGRTAETLRARRGGDTDGASALGKAVKGTAAYLGLTNLLGRAEDVPSALGRAARRGADRLGLTTV